MDSIFDNIVKGKDYFEEILLAKKLVDQLKKEKSKLEIELGQLKSYVSELEDLSALDNKNFLKNLSTDEIRKYHKITQYINFSFERNIEEKDIIKDLIRKNIDQESVIQYYKNKLSESKK